jgi:tRNA wybutosine-synthesizing protein 3
LRFVENKKRIGRLREELKRGFEKKGEGREWESTESRRERKKAEGLRAKECKLREKRGESGSERNEGGREEEDDGIGLDLMNDL